MRALWLAVPLLGCLAISSFSSAQVKGFEPVPQMTKPSAEILENDRLVVIRSRLLNWLNEDLSAFLESGLPLTLTFKAGIFERRDFWFDAQISSVVVSKQVTFDPVSGSFTILVQQDEKKTSKTFVDKQEAMQFLLGLEVKIPIPLWLEKHPRRSYYAGVCCEVTARKMLFPLRYILWFWRPGYSTAWSFSETISTRSLQGDGFGKSRSERAARLREYAILGEAR